MIALKYDSIQDTSLLDEASPSVSVVNALSRNVGKYRKIVDK